MNAQFISPEIVTDDPVPGVLQAIKQLRTQYKVVVYSCRCNDLGGIAAIKRWLNQHSIEVDNVVNYKPVAEVYVDDRAVPFMGDWGATLEDIERFKPWLSRIKNRVTQNRRRFR